VVGCGGKQKKDLDVEQAVRKQRGRARRKARQGRARKREGKHEGTGGKGKV
jgi:hypothetical protein